MTAATDDLRARGLELATRTRGAQGLPPTVKDPTVLLRLGAIVAGAKHRAELEERGE